MNLATVPVVGGGWIRGWSDVEGVVGRLIYSAINTPALLEYPLLV